MRNGAEWGFNGELACSSWSYRVCDNPNICGQAHMPGRQAIDLRSRVCAGSLVCLSGNQINSRDYYTAHHDQVQALGLATRENHRTVHNGGAMQRAYPNAVEHRPISARSVVGPGQLGVRHGRRSHLIG